MSKREHAIITANVAEATLEFVYGQTARNVAAAVRGLREELCTRDRQCVCGTWEDIPGPCCHHIAVNAQLDVLDRLAVRLGLGQAEVTAPNEPVIRRGTLRGMA